MSSRVRNLGERNVRIGAMFALVQYHSSAVRFVDCMTHWTSLQRLRLLCGHGSLTLAFAWNRAVEEECRVGTCAGP